MTTEKLPCGHEIDEEMLRMAVALSKVKAQGTDTIYPQFTCRQLAGHPDGKPIKWQLRPRMWVRVKPKTTVEGNSTPNSSGAQ